MNTKRIALFATLAAAGLGLAACQGADESEQPAAVTNVEDLGTMNEALPNVTAEAPAATRIDNASTESEPAQATLTADEQTQDDADATGMTARVSRDEAGNDTGQPAQ